MNLKKLLNKISVVLVLLTVFAGATLAQTYPTVYVSQTNGAATYTGEKEFNDPLLNNGPVNSIALGLARVQNGGTLVIIADTYSTAVDINSSTYPNISSGITIQLAPLRAEGSLVVIAPVVQLNAPITFNIVGGTLNITTGSTPGTTATLVQTFVGATITLQNGTVNLSSSSLWQIGDNSTIVINGTAGFATAAPSKTAAGNTVNLTYTGGGSFTAGQESNLGSYGTGIITISKTAGSTVTLQNAITELGGIIGITGNATFSGAVAMDIYDVDNQGQGTLTFGGPVTFSVDNSSNLGQVINQSIGSVVFNGAVTWTAIENITVNINFGGTYVIENQSSGALQFNGTITLVGDPTAAAGVYQTITFIARNNTGNLKLGMMTTDAKTILSVLNNGVGGVVNIQGGEYRGSLTNIASATVNINGGTTVRLALTNAGTIILGSNILTLSGAVAHLTNGGTVSGAGRISVTNATGTAVTFNGGNLGNLEVASAGTGTVTFGTNNTTVNTFTLTSGAVTVDQITLNATNYYQDAGTFTLTTFATSILNTKGNFYRTPTDPATFSALSPTTVSFAGGTTAQTVQPGNLFQVYNLVFNNTYAVITIGNSIRAKGTITVAIGTTLSAGSLNIIVNGDVPNKIINNGVITSTGGGGVILGGGGVPLVTGGTTGNGFQLAGTGVYGHVTVDVGAANTAQVTTDANVGCKWSGVLTLRTGTLDVATTFGGAPIDFGPSIAGGTIASIVRWPETSNGLTTTVGTFNAANNYPYNVTYTGSLSATRYCGQEIIGPFANVANWTVSVTGTVALAGNAAIDALLVPGNLIPAISGGVGYLNQYLAAGYTYLTIPVAYLSAHNLNFVGSLTLAGTAVLNLPTGTATGFTFNPSFYAPQALGTSTTQTINGAITLADAAGGPGVADAIEFNASHIIVGGGTSAALLGNTSVLPNASVTVSGLGTTSGGITPGFQGFLQTQGNATLTLAGTEYVAGGIYLGAALHNLQTYNLNFRGTPNTIDPSATFGGTGFLTANSQSGTQLLDAPVGATSAFTVPYFNVNNANNTLPTLIGSSGGAQDMIVSNTFNVTLGDFQIANGHKIIVTGNTINLYASGSDILAGTGQLVTMPGTGILNLLMNAAVRTIPNIVVNGPTALGTVSSGTSSSTLVANTLAQNSDLNLNAWNLSTPSFLRTVGANTATTGYLEITALTAAGSNGSMTQGIGFVIPNLKISDSIAPLSPQGFTVSNNLYLNNHTFTQKVSGTARLTLGITGGPTPNITVEGAGNLDSAPAAFTLGMANYVFANTVLPIASVGATGGQVTITSTSAAFREFSVTAATASSGSNTFTNSTASGHAVTVLGNSATGVQYAIIAFSATAATVAGQVDITVANYPGFLVGQSVAISGNAQIPDGNYVVQGYNSTTVFRIPYVGSTGGVGSGNVILAGNIPGDVIINAPSHGFVLNDVIAISGNAVVIGLNGTWQVKGVIDANNFRITAATIAASSAVCTANYVNASPVNGSVDITTTTAHNLLTGQSVTITGGPFAGGPYSVTNVSPTVFRIPFATQTLAVTSPAGAVSYTGASTSGTAGIVTVTAAGYTYVNGQTIQIKNATLVGANGEPTLNGTYTIIVPGSGGAGTFDIALAGKSNAASILGGTVVNYVSPSSVATSGYIDVTTATAHGFSNGSVVVISGGALAGTYTLPVAPPSSFVFTILRPGDPTGAGDVAAANPSYVGTANLATQVPGDVLVTTALPTGINAGNSIYISGSSAINGYWTVHTLLNPSAFYLTIPSIAGGGTGTVANITNTTIGSTSASPYWPGTAGLAQDVTVNYSPVLNAPADGGTVTGRAILGASRTAANNLFLTSGYFQINNPGAGSTLSLTYSATNPIITKSSNATLEIVDLTGTGGTAGQLIVPATGANLVYTTAPQTIGREWTYIAAINNVTVNAYGTASSSPFTITSSAKTILGNFVANENVLFAPASGTTLTLNGNLTMAANKTFTIASGAVLSSLGNVTLNSGAVITGAGSLSFTGGNAQAVALSSANSTVTNISINKSANDVTITGGDLTANGLVTFVKGDIKTGATNKLFITVPTHGDVFSGTKVSQGFIGASNASMVVGNVAKKFLNDNNVNNSSEEINRFPVGDGTNYRPIALTFNPAFGFPTVPNNITIVANFANSTPGGAIGLPIVDGVATGINIARYPSFYWGLTTSGTVSPQLVFDLEVVAAGYTNYDDVNNIRIIRRYGVGTDVANEWNLQGDAAQYDNTLNGTVPTIISKNSTGGLRTGGAVFTLGLKSNMSIKTPIAKQWLVKSATVSENRPISLADLFKGNIGTLTYAVASSNVAVVTVRMQNPTSNILVVSAQGLGDCIVTVTGTDATTNDLFAFSFPVNVGPTDVASTEQLPTEFALFQNYPNPFNPTTNIRFDLPKESNVTLKIYNILGEEVAKLVDKVMPAGRQSVSFDASKLSSGMYIYRIQAADFVQVKKMLLMK